MQRSIPPGRRGEMATDASFTPDVATAYAPPPSARIPQHHHSQVNGMAGAHPMPSPQSTAPSMPASMKGDVGKKEASSGKEVAYPRSRSSSSTSGHPHPTTNPPLVPPTNKQSQASSSSSKPKSKSKTNRSRAVAATTAGAKTAPGDVDINLAHSIFEYYFILMSK